MRGEPETTDVNYEQIVFFRNLFFRAFLIGFAFALFYFLATCAGWNTWAAWWRSFFNIDEREFSRLVMAFFLEMRIVLVFFFLVPTLALHWMAKTRQRKDSARR